MVRPVEMFSLKTLNVGFANKLIYPHLLNKWGYFIYNVSMEKWIYSQIIKYYKSLKNVSVLDCGCGCGNNSLMLAGYGARVSAFDKSEKKIDNLKLAAYKMGLNINAQTCTILDFIPDQLYEIVLFNNVLHFVPKEDRSVALDIVLKSVKPGGLLVYCDLADDSPPEEETKTKLYKKLEKIDEGFIYLDDKPHPGANYPHKHTIHYLVGKKVI